MPWSRAHISFKERIDGKDTIIQMCCNVKSIHVAQLSAQSVYINDQFILPQGAKEHFFTLLWAATGPVTKSL